MTDILAFDIATHCGFARGLVGAAPTAGTLKFSKTAASSENAIFAAALTAVSSMLEPKPRPDIVLIEAMLPPGAMGGETTRSVRDRLAGLHGIIRAVAYLRGIYRIETVTVGDVRGHFLGTRALKRDPAKRATMEVCRRLGWPVDDDNAADALAVWSYGCAQIEPTWALQVTPLFNPKLRYAR